MKFRILACTDTFWNRSIKVCEKLNLFVNIGNVLNSSNYLTDTTEDVRLSSLVSAFSVTIQTYSNKSPNYMDTIKRDIIVIKIVFADAHSVRLPHLLLFMHQCSQLSHFS